jgi:hypothetical protein
VFCYQNGDPIVCNAAKYGYDDVIRKCLENNSNVIRDKTKVIVHALYFNNAFIKAHICTFRAGILP